MISTILLASIFIVLIHRCYKMEVEIHDIKLKHNELAKIVSINATILKSNSNSVDIIIDEISRALETYYKEKGEVTDGE